jgi:hypothetical protein
VRETKEKFLKNKEKNWQNKRNKHIKTLKKKVSISSLLRKVDVFCALSVHWMLLSNLSSSGFCLQYYIFTPVSPPGPGLQRCNLGEMGV